MLSENFKNKKSILRAKTAPGFTLVEVLVVLFIVSFGLVGILSLIVQNIQSQNYNKNGLVAYQLAQEGNELIRRVRDSNWKAGVKFDTGLEDDNYIMDYQDSLPIHYGGNLSETKLKKDQAGFYVHDSNLTTDSGFTRLFRISSSTSNMLRINSVVTWTDKDKYYSYNLESLLYDWYPNQ